MKYIPIDRQMFKDLHVCLSRRRRLLPKYYVGEESDADGTCHQVFRIPGATGLEYRFKTRGVAPREEATPCLGRRAFEILVAMIYFAKCNNGLQGQFKLKRLARFLKEKPPGSGRYYQDIRRTLHSLASATILVAGPNPECGRRYSFVADWGCDPKTRTYHYTLDRDALGITALWLQESLTQENMGAGYVQYPIAFIKAPLTETEKAFRDYLLVLRNTITARTYTIARDWCGLPEDALKRKGRVRSLVYGFLRNAVTRNDIVCWKPTPFKLNTWKSDWKITITKPRKPRNRTSENFRSPTQCEQTLIDEIVEWQCRPIHGLRLTEAEHRECTRNVVLAYGADAIEKLYRDHGCGAYPSVHRFWQAVKSLKAERHSKDRSAGGDRIEADAN